MKYPQRSCRGTRCISQRFNRHIERLERRIFFSAVGEVETLASIVAFPDGAGPSGALVRDRRGDLFGATNGGGTYDDGTIFELKRGSSAISLLATFDGTNGANPFAGLAIDSEGNLFGTTSAGGPSGGGTIFDVASGSNTITTLAPFDSKSIPSSGAPLALDSSGNLFGTTAAGGTNMMGTIFELTHGSNSLTTLANFNGLNGNSPNGVLLDHAGDLFGTTQYGGASGIGVAFEFEHESNQLLTVASFDVTNGDNPQAGLVADARGNLFGTCFGGAKNLGTVFEIVHRTLALKTIATFTGIHADDPAEELSLDSNGNLYGTAGGVGGTSDIVFEVKRGTGITVLGDLGRLGDSSGGVALDNHGNAYGAFDDGGSGGLFSIALTSGKTRVLARFGEFGLDGPFNCDPMGDIYAGSSDGIVEVPQGSNSFTTIAHADWASPNQVVSQLVYDGSGNLYGTLSQDESNRQTIFELRRGARHINVIASVEIGPGAGVIVDSEGNIFGLSFIGGRNHDGFVFEIPRLGRKFMKLASFDDNLGRPGENLSVDSKGDLFGISSPYDLLGGRVFELPSGSKNIILLNSDAVFSTDENIAIDGEDDLFVPDSAGGYHIYKFPRGSSAPVLIATYLPPTDHPTGLVVDGNGNLFGAGMQSVTEFVAGTYAATTLAQFQDILDNQGAPTIVRDSNGNLYVSTYPGGTSDTGAIYKITT